ncbi:MAG TPA: hypothetical protein VEJ63_01135 [Planctomycetota bacterium]|nr:hypothetical protein [Planctomycetota bacterium]
MRTLCLLIVAASAFSGWAHDQILPQMKAPPELVTAEAITAYLNEEADHLSWPEFVLKKEIGAQRDGGRIHVFAIFHLKTIERKETARLVIRAAGLFASALADNAHIHKAVVTLKCPGHTGRMFIPVPALKVLSDDMEERAQFTFEQKKELVNACDWVDLDRVADECERLAFEDGPRRTPEPPAQGILHRMVFKNERWIEVANFEELNGCYLLQDEFGRFMRLRCSDVKRILPPDPKLLALK